MSLINAWVSPVPNTQSTDEKSTGIVSEASTVSGLPAADSSTQALADDLGIIVTNSECGTSYSVKSHPSVTAEPLQSMPAPYWSSLQKTSLPPGGGLHKDVKDSSLHGSIGASPGSDRASFSSEADRNSSNSLPSSVPACNGQSGSYQERSGSTRVSQGSTRVSLEPPGTLMERRTSKQSSGSIQVSAINKTQSMTSMQSFRSSPQSLYSHQSHQSRRAAPHSGQQRHSVFGVMGADLSAFPSTTKPHPGELIEIGDALADAEKEAHAERTSRSNLPDHVLSNASDSKDSKDSASRNGERKTKRSSAASRARSSMASMRVSALKSVVSSFKAMVEDDPKENVTPDAVNLNPTEETMNYTNVKHHHRRRCVLMPGSLFLTTWRLIMAFSVVWAVILSTLMLGFSWWEPPHAVKIVNGVVEVLFYVDMVVSFFTAKMAHGRLIHKHSDIAKGYLKSWFVIDVITNFPWDKLVDIGTGDGDQGKKSRKLVKALKMPKIARVIRLLRVATDEAVYFGTVFSVVKLAFISHCFCCLWAVLLIDCEDESCPEVGAAYAEGITVGFATLAGADAWLRFRGSGGGASGGSFSAYSWTDSPDILAEIAAAVSCLIGMLALAVLFANVANTLQSLGSHTLVFNERLSNLKAASTQHDIPHELYARVKNHFHYVWSCGSDASVALLRDRALTVDLRRQLGMSYYGRQLKSVPFLARCEEGFLKQLCMRVEMECFSPSDHIIEAGETGTELYFLVTGRARIQLPTSGKILKILEEGCYFGEMAFLFPDTCRTVHVIAETFGWLLYVDRTALEEICSDELLDQFREIAMERFNLSCGPINNSTNPAKSGRLCSCGNELMTDARFCRKCGEKVQEVSQTEVMDVSRGDEIGTHEVGKRQSDTSMELDLCIGETIQEEPSLDSTGKLAKANDYSREPSGDHQRPAYPGDSMASSLAPSGLQSMADFAGANQRRGSESSAYSHDAVRGRSMSTISAFKGSDKIGWKSIRRPQSDAHPRARRSMSLISSPELDPGHGGAVSTLPVLERPLQQRAGASGMAASVERLEACVERLGERLESRLDNFITEQRNQSAEQRLLVLKLQEQVNRMEAMQCGRGSCSSSQGVAKPQP